MDLNYQLDIEIDEHNLDQEWKKQASLMFAYGQAKVEAQYQYDKAKERLDLLIAEKDAQIREEVTDKKRTEAAIANLIQSMPSVQDAQGAVYEAKRNLNMLSAAVEALQHKKTALENLVRLYGMNYFVEPTEDIIARGTIDDMTSRIAVDKVKQAMKRTKE